VAGFGSSHVLSPRLHAWHSCPNTQFPSFPDCKLLSSHDFMLIFCHILRILNYPIDIYPETFIVRVSVLPNIH
jgi:hypothetical protein